MTETTRPRQDPRAPDIRRRTLTTFGYTVVAVVPVLIAAVGIGLLYLNYDPDDVVQGRTVPILTSDWRPGDGGEDALISGELRLEGGCLHLVAEGGGSVTPVWPAGYQATDDDGLVQLFDADRDVVARGGDQVQMGGGFHEVGEYAGRRCAPDSGQVAVVQSEVTVVQR